MIINIIFMILKNTHCFVRKAPYRCLTRRQYIAVLADFIQAGRLAETRNVCIFPVTITPPVMVRIGDLLDVLVGQFPMGSEKTRAALGPGWLAAEPSPSG